MLHFSLVFWQRALFLKRVRRSSDVIKRMLTKAVIGIDVGEVAAVKNRVGEGDWLVDEVVNVVVKRKLTHHVNQTWVFLGIA